MDKRIEDYLHLYLGCEGLYLAGYGVHGKKQVKAKFVGFTSQGKLILICYDITGKEWGYDVVADFYEFIPAIRPLSDMTEEEVIVLFNLGRGLYHDNKIDAVKRYATNEFYLRKGVAEYIFGYCDGFNNDVRVLSGYTFYIKQYYIKDDLCVTDLGFTSTPSHFNPIKEIDGFISCYNQTEIFIHLLKQGFDLFGLIDAGLAIDKTKL